MLKGYKTSWPAEREKTMSKKGENIFNRKDGRWEARYEKGRHPDGSIIYGFCYGKSYHEAREKVNGCKADVLLGKAINAKGIKGLFGTYCDEWTPRSAPL